MRFRLARAARLGASSLAPRFSAALLILLALAFALVGALPAAAQEIACYAVADEGGGDGSGADDFAEDLLTRVDPDDADPETNETSIGTGTGTFRIEAAAFQPGTEVLFAVDGGRLGTLDLTSGDFDRSPSPLGEGSGAGGVIEYDDVDGLTFDPETGTLYGSQRVREGGPDVLLIIDPETGVAVDDAFGQGEDYAQITPLSGETKIDDLAVDGNGTMYAIANAGGHGDRLISIDPETGTLTDIGATGQDDMEGLTIAPDGNLMAVTGKEAFTPPGEALWDLDKTSGKASNPRPLDNADDYEAVSCVAAAQAPPPEQPVSVSVEVGACPAAGSPTVPVTISIDPPGSAEVTIDEGPGTPIVVGGDGAVLDLPPGDYHWDADPADDFFMDDDSGEFSVEACPAVAPAVGSITIVKNALPDDAADFQFGGDLGTFALDDDGDATLPGSRTWEVDAGRYEIVESAVDGWKLTEIACIDPDGGTDGDVSSRTATVDVDDGENVVCTFTNARLAVLGNPPIPPTGVPGLGILTSIGMGFILSGFVMRSAADGGDAFPAIGLRPRPIDAYAAHRVTGQPSPPSGLTGDRWSSPAAPARRHPATVAAPQRGPPRPRSP